MSKFFSLVLFFVISLSAFAKNNYSQSNYHSHDSGSDEVETRGRDQIISFTDFENGVSIHICPIENWSEYKLMVENNIFSQNLTLLADIVEKNNSRSSLYVTWPINNPIVVICTEKATIVKSTINSSIAIISNKLLTW